MTNRLFMGAVDVIVLAAGRSLRLGQPKALVDVDGRPLVTPSHSTIAIHQRC